MDKVVVITFGRFQPPSIGHALLFKKMVECKSVYNAAESLVYTSHKQESKKNPLSYEDKVKYLDLLLDEQFPELAVVNTHSRTIITVLQELESEYMNVIVVVGGDRTDEFGALLNKYNMKEYEFESIKIVSAGDRDPDSDSPTGMSATKLRNSAMENDIETFSRGIDSNNPEIIEGLFLAVRRGMKLSESREKYILDPLTIEELKEYYLMHEEDESASDGEAQEGETGLQKKVSELFAKAGIDGFSDAGESAQSLTLTPEGDEIEGKLPEKDAGTYVGDVAVLLVDSLVGTKFLTKFIGDYYLFEEEALKQEGKQLEALRVVSRELAGSNANDNMEKLSNLKIAWSSPVANSLYKDSEMKIDFASQDTEELLKKIGGKTITLSTLGSLTTDSLKTFAQSFKDQFKKLFNEDKDISVVDLVEEGNNELEDFKKTVLAKEAEANKILQSLKKRMSSKQKPTRKEIDEFSKNYGVDSRIIGNSMTLDFSREKKDTDLESRMSDLKDLGISGVFEIIDGVNAQKNKKIDKLEKKDREFSAGTASEPAKKH